MTILRFITPKDVKLMYGVMDQLINSTSMLYLYSQSTHLHSKLDYIVVSI